MCSGSCARVPSKANRAKKKGRLGRQQSCRAAAMEPLEAQLSRKEQFAERMHVLARVGRFSPEQLQQLMNQLERDDEEAADYLRFLTLRNPPLFHDTGARFTPERAEQKQPWLREFRRRAEGAAAASSATPSDASMHQ